MVRAMRTMRAMRAMPLVFVLLVLLLFLIRNHVGSNSTQKRSSQSTKRSTSELVTHERTAGSSYES